MLRGLVVFVLVFVAILFVMAVLGGNVGSGELALVILIAIAVAMFDAWRKRGHVAQRTRARERESRRPIVSSSCVRAIVCRARSAGAT